MIFVFYTLNSNILISKNDFIRPTKTKSYKIVLTVCICGAVLIALGNKVLNNNTVLIIGAVIFAPTFSVLVTQELIALIRYITCIKEKNKTP